MNDGVSPNPMSTAAEVWCRFVKEGVLLPRTYDEDIVSLLERQLPSSGALPVRMKVAGWTARDLLRAISPVVDSFASLMRDLLSLYSAIAASHATKGNLTLSYEFVEGDVFDQSLAQFRSTVATLNRVQAVRGSFVLSPQRWEYPSVATRLLGDAKVSTLRDEGEDGWAFTLPAPPEANNPAVARGVSLVYAVLTAACDRLGTYGSTMGAVLNNVALWNESKAELAEYRRLYFDFTDYLPEAVILRLRADVEYLASKPSSDTDSWLRGVETWCSSFWETEAYEAEAALDSVLSLPMWGKRHELYSAWVVCVIAEAFKERNLNFEVVNGRLSFPFKATKIATFEDRAGPVELWAEVKSAASGKLSHGRKQGVQPDYRFLRPGKAPSDTDMAVEVKHYGRAAATRHGDTARDYARALPRARVTIVAHGPIGKTAVGRVDGVDRPRVAFRENVRSLVSAESRAFIDELTGVFPPAWRVQIIEVVQSCVDEVELRVMSQGQNPGRGPILLRGTRIEALPQSMEAEVVLDIVCHPERRHTIREARPRVALTLSDGEVRFLEAVQPNPSAGWDIGTLRGARFTISASAVESVA